MWSLAKLYLGSKVLFGERWFSPCNPAMYSITFHSCLWLRRSYTGFLWDLSYYYIPCPWSDLSWSPLLERLNNDLEFPLPVWLCVAGVQPLLRWFNKLFQPDGGQQLIFLSSWEFAFVRVLCCEKQTLLIEPSSLNKAGRPPIDWKQQGHIFLLLTAQLCNIGLFTSVSK